MTLQANLKTWKQIQIARYWTICFYWTSKCKRTQSFVCLYSWSHLLFWYHVLTWVSVRLSDAASSILSCTLRYFCLSKLRSSWASWWSVNAVRAFRGFLSRTGGLSLLLEISLSPSSFTETQKKTLNRWQTLQTKKNTTITDAEW